MEVKDAKELKQILLNTPYKNLKEWSLWEIMQAKDYYIRQMEEKRVNSHITNAIATATEATLTLDEWIETLEYWCFSCAYCMGSYQVLEHYIPVAHGGGTSATNCVPACYACNNRKGNLHPQQVLQVAHFDPYSEAGRFQDRIKAIGRFLAQKAEVLG